MRIAEDGDGAESAGGGTVSQVPAVPPVAKLDETPGGAMVENDAMAGHHDADGTQELLGKVRRLEKLNRQLERRLADSAAALEASNARLAQAEQGRSLALAAGQMGSWDWDLASGRWQWDDGTYRIFGVDPRGFAISADTIRELIHPDDWQLLAGLGANMAAGARSRQGEFRVVRRNGDIRWCIASAAASVDGGGRVVRVSGIVIDVTDRKEAEERQILLAREVDHRARNALAVIQSIIRLTRADTVGGYVEAIEGRIKALTRAHTLLSDSRWDGADLATLVDDELTPYRAGGKVACRGPGVSLRPAMAQGLALALHELATNAARHGALSAPAGTIALDWDLQPDALNLHWVENGGPAITAPPAHNLGLKVIIASIEQQLGGKADFDWNPRGLRCAFAIPRGELTKARVCRATRFAAGNDNVERYGTGLQGRDRPRVLVVEDEALVAMMIKETLAEFGFHVLGPLSTASEALVAAQDGKVDAAVLDINLGDDLVYAVAEILLARGVPFVFVTGYDADSVDSRFADIPVLQKPIERESLRWIFFQTGRRAAAT
jgi:two-component sensor histidine kinase/CheY-like chemotaxis protein